MKVSKAPLNQLIQNKIHAAGLSQDHAAIVADVLAHADARGIHSHGAVRVEYYAERISKGGINNHPNFTFTPTGPCSAVFDGDNGAGHVAAKMMTLKWRNLLAWRSWVFAVSVTAVHYPILCSRQHTRA